MSNFISLATAGMDSPEAYGLLSGAVVPRPIAWITTMDWETDRVNAAPFSAYTFVSHSPPMLAVNIASRNGELKDTARNLRANGEFVVHVVNLDHLDDMVATSEEFGPEVSEPERYGLELLPSQQVRVPRMACSPIHMECRLERFIPLGRGINTLYIGEVLVFHLAPDVFDGRHIDSARLQPLARFGGPTYATPGTFIRRATQHAGAQPSRTAPSGKKS